MDVNEFWQKKYREEACRSWNIFYKRNEDRFFKDRHWIEREFPQIADPSVKRILEVGCGVGNFILTLLEDTNKKSFEEEKPYEMVYACDFSERAIEILKQDARYDPLHCCAFVADLTKSCMQESVPPASIDVISCIFVLSAIPPEKFAVAISNMVRCLAPGGRILFRDYSEEDAARYRFKQDRRLGDRLFVRQDGTLSYFFSVSELCALFDRAGLRAEDCRVVKSKTVNVKKLVDVERSFVQGVFKKVIQ